MLASKMMKRFYFILTIFILSISIKPSLGIGQAARIRFFHIVRTDNGKVVRRLRENDVLRFGFGFTLIARTSGPTKNVTYVSPRLDTATKRPFALRGISRLAQGQYRAYAYVNGNKDQSLEMKFRVRYPGFPIRGPSPFKLKPINDNWTNYSPIQVYPISGLCNDDYQGPITVTNYRLYDTFFDCASGKLPGATYDAFVCAPKDSLNLRVRMVEIFKRKGKLNSYVKPVLIPKNAFFETSVSIFNPQDRFICPRGPIYYEVCDVLGNRGCGTSLLESYSPSILLRPKFSKILPKQVKLRPGDSTTLRFRNIQSKHSLAGRESCKSDTRFSFQIIVQSRKGVILKRSRIFKRRNVFIHLRKITEQYDGALVFFEYSYPFCPTVKEIGSFKTIISVK